SSDVCSSDLDAAPAGRHGRECRRRPLVVAVRGGGAVVRKTIHRDSAGNITGWNEDPTPEDESRFREIVRLVEGVLSGVATAALRKFAPAYYHAGRVQGHAEGVAEGARQATPQAHRIGYARGARDVSGALHG